jgi:aspartate racemase
LYSVDFASIESMQVEGEWDEAAAALAGAARVLEVAGADFIVLCTNTMHKVADQVQAAVGIPLLHLADTTAVAVKEHRIRRVGLLGTRFTMTQDFYRDRLTSHGIEVIVPDVDDQQVVHNIIYDELCQGIVRAESRVEYRRVIQGLVESGAEGIIYGCTEIELLVDETDSSVPVFPTTRLHCEAAADRAMGAVRVRCPQLP